MRGKKGFTLIELVVTIAILGIIAGIGVPRMMEYFKVSRGHRMITDLRLLDGAIGYYIAENGVPPTSLDDLVPKLVAAVPEKLGADFIVKKNNGEEKEYKGTESWNFGIDPVTNRAIYGGGADHNLEFYLNGEGSGGLAGNMPAVAGLLKDYRVANSESLWGAFIGSDNAYYQQLKDMGATGATLFRSGPGGGNNATLAFTTVDWSSAKTSVLVPVIYAEYNPTTDSYEYKALVGAVQHVADGNIAIGWNNNRYSEAENEFYSQNGVERQAITPYTTLDKAMERYENLVKGYNEGLLTATGNEPNYYADAQGNVTKK